MLNAQFPLGHVLEIWCSPAVCLWLLLRAARLAEAAKAYEALADASRKADP